MEREIGRTGVRVHAVGWGVMPLSTRSARPERESALPVFRAALEAGVTFWDTANSYCLDDTETGHNERLIAWALRELGVADRVHVATKGGMERPRGAWVRNGRPAHLKAACEQSLRDLGVEQIWLYQLHWPDPAVPYAESVGALADLQREGKIRHVGVSNVSPQQLREAQGVVRVESVQNRCNPSDADDLRNGLLAACAEQGVTYIPYAPVGGQGGYKSLARGKVLGDVAKAYAASPYQVSLAWLLAQGPHVVPIPGGSRTTSVTDSAAAARLTLEHKDLARIDALAR